MHNDFFRAASCSPRVVVGDVDANVEYILNVLHRAEDAGADLAVLPEMALTAYTCGDLFHNSTLIDAAWNGLEKLVKGCPTGLPLTIVGMPLVAGGQMFNCAVAFSREKVYGIVPKSYIPNYNEFYERRWFTPASECRVDSIALPFDPTREVPVGTDLIFQVNGVKVGAEICEDLWTPIPPSCHLAMNGAEVIVNLSASDDVVGKYAYLEQLVKQQSARCIAGYVYASAGFGESSTDLVFDGKNFVVDNGRMLAKTDRRARCGKLAVADIDIAALRRDRLHLTTYADCGAQNPKPYRLVECRSVHVQQQSGLMREVDPLPFVPSDKGNLAERCEEIIHIQQSGLAKRLDATHTSTIVVGISGGLDSTLALLVAVRAFDSLGLDRKGIIGITMPGFGTTGRTHSNALKLMKALGVTQCEIPIGPAVEQHFKDIGHDPKVQDVTYENSQARERTQILMDVANQAGGMVLGTGDLSELALGWATYNGDQMSMYGVNSGVPKTLVKHLVGYFADEMEAGEGRDALIDIIGTPISPELIPADSHGNITQKTEDLVGPYELHDFFLYYMLRYGFSPSRIYLLAKKAFDGRSDHEVIRKWLKTFFRRFFSQQFKRSCMPDGPKVGSVTLSPRGDWRMPSDASSALWLKECDKLPQD